jgi:sulfite exporter TauE/SafE
LITIIISGLLLGLVSSLHCVGMCGPLVMSLPLMGRKTSPVISMMVYNGGRITTYVLFGLIFGIFGRQLYMAGFQKGLTIMMGLFLLGFALYQWLPKSKNGIMGWFGWINVYLLKLSKNPSTGALWLMGMLNGCLPCGMVYIAIASSLAFQPVLHGGIYMFFFGMGTLPLLLGAGFLGWKINIATRQKILRLIPVYSMVLGVVLILRGMELGIPMLSPMLPQKLNDFIHCF